jgi:iron complex outermembrane receptor protein
MNLEVTSVSGQTKKVSHTASAIFVITAEDIRRSGATSIPEALRLVPGLQVMQITDNLWAIGSRGFAFRYANKLQVLVDGRSLYTTVYGGVDWNVHNMMLEDVERIEVVRGPGASLWGGNAFNGVINIITRHSRDTQGGLLATSVGSHEQIHSTLRYGGRISPNATYRAGAQFFNREGSKQVSGEPARDGGDVLQGGFRVDWNPTPSDEVTFTGGAEDRDTDNLSADLLWQPSSGPLLFERLEWRTSVLMGRWQHYYERGDAIALQWSYDWLSRQETVVEDDRRTLSLDFRHHLPIGSRQDLLWGVGSNRFDADFTLGEGEASANRPFEFHEVGSRYILFAQDEIALVPEKFFLIPGARLQHETDSGWNFQPNLRALWVVNGHHSAWGSVARALRTSTEVEENARITLGTLGDSNSIPTFLTLTGNDEFKSERLLAYELGYRAELPSGVSFDLATFFNVYHDLRSLEPQAPFFTSEPPFPRIEVPLKIDNKLDGKTYGAEVAATWRVNSWWTVRGAYTRLEIGLNPRADSNDPQAEMNEGTSPNHQFNLRSGVRLPWNLQFDASLYHVSSLPNLSIDSYARLDSQITWSPLEQAAITVGGQNLLRPRHPEFARFLDTTVAGQAERNIYAKLTWRF